MGYNRDTAIFTFFDHDFVELGLRPNMIHSSKPHVIRRDKLRAYRHLPRHPEARVSYQHTLLGPRHEF
jgi:hypothetical protein